MMATTELKSTSIQDTKNLQSNTDKMPSISSDIKDLMCYQINKFQRTTNQSSISTFDPEGQPPPLPNKPSLNPSSIVLYQNIPQNRYPYDNNYENINCDCEFESKTQQKASLTNHSHHLSRHLSFHYCPEYESKVKRSRSIRFGSGGDMIIDKTQGYTNTNWLESSTSVPLREKSNYPPSIPRRPRSCILTPSPSGINSNTNLTISLNLPSSIDLDSFLQNHSLSISLNVSDRTGTHRHHHRHHRTPQSDRRARDAYNRSQLIQSGWYYQHVDWQESILILRSSPIGTFIVRDSGDPRYSFSLSVQTGNGPISSRISQNPLTGQYHLDSQAVDTDRMPAFPTIIGLIGHYIKNGLGKVKSTSSNGKQVWIDSHGQVCSPVQLTKPKLKEPLTLKHLARLSLNKNLGLSDMVGIPSSIRTYLQDYPYTF